MSEEANTPPAPTEASGSILNQPVELGEGEVWLAEGVKGKAEGLDWYKADKYKTVAEQAKAYSELEKKFGGFKGAPESYQMPDLGGIQLDPEDPLYSQFSEWAKGKNMDQDAFGEAIEMLSTYVETADAIDQKQELEKLGPQAGQLIQQAGRFLDNHFEGEDLQRARDALTTADSVWLVNKLIGATAPPKLPSEGGHNPEGLTADTLREMANKTNEAGQLLRSVDPAYNRQVQQAYEKFYGDQPAQSFVG